MKVIAPGDVEIDLGTVQTTPTVGIIDYSRRVTDDFGTTTVVERGFARRMSVRLALPFDEVDEVQRQLAELRATAAQWIADEDRAWLNFEGFYKDFELDLALPPLSFCTLTVEGLAETETVPDAGEDPAPDGDASTLLLVQPVNITPAMLTATNVPETDWPEWDAITVYPVGARVIKAATHRIYESVAATNVANDPAGVSGKWIDVGPTNRWAMFDQALGTATTRNDGIAITVAPGDVDALALLDVVGTTVRVQKGAYDQTKPVGAGAITFLDLPGGAGNITVTISGAGAVSVGTFLVGRLVSLGITAESPTAGISDFSRKEVDDFGEATIVERAWAKRMSARALLASDAIDIVADRIATVRAKPSLWIADDGTDSLTVYGFFKDFSIEVGETVSTLSLTVEGLSEAMPIVEDFDGRSILEKTIYKRSATDPVTPAGGSFDFDTMVATVPAGWSAFVPAGTDPVYVSSAIASKEGPGGSADFGAWSPPAIAFTLGDDGAPGSPGSPGAPGATFYTWYAYADAPNGTFNFTTGAPGSRSYQGIATGKTTATESTNPADYDWSPYVGPPNFGLASFNSNTVLAGNKIIRINSGSWDAAIHSTESFKGGASVTFIADQNTLGLMVGLNTDPTTDASYASIDYAIYLAHDGGINVYESSVHIGYVGPYLAGDVFTVTYNNKEVVYSKNGVAFRTVAASAGLTLFLDSSMEGGAAQYGRILSFTAAGQAGTNGTDGAPGAPGANGTTYYTWYAYADAPDGSFNFSAGVPGGRQYQGVAYNKTTATESANPADYTWSDYIGPPNFGLAAFDANTVIAGNKLIKVAGGIDWNASVHSTESFKGGASVSFVVDRTDQLFMVGLNTDPTTDASYASIDFAIYVNGTSTLTVFQGGVGVFDAAAAAVGDVLSVTYNNRTVVYSKNGVPFYTNSSPATNLALYLDSSLYGTAGQYARVLAFTAAGTAGSDGSPGAPGSPGVSPVSAVAVPTNKQFMAESDGTIKDAGSVLPFNVAIDGMKAGATISGTVTILAVSGCTATAISGGFTINTVTADAGFVSWRFTASDGQIVENKMSFSRQRDPASGGQVAVNFSSTSWWGSGSYGATGPATVLPASSTGKLAIAGYATFYCSGNGQAYLTGKLQYRAVGSGTWIDSGFTSGPSVAIKTADFPGEPGENSPGEVSPGGTLTGLTANGSYEVQMVGLRNASFNAIASASGFITLRQVL